MTPKNCIPNQRSSARAFLEEEDANLDYEEEGGGGNIDVDLSIDDVNLEMDKKLIEKYNVGDILEECEFGGEKNNIFPSTAGTDKSGGS